MEFPDCKTPVYLISIEKIKSNLEILKKIQKRTNAKILLALKAFAMFEIFPLLNEVLSGVSASSLYEARLGYEDFEKEVHTYAPAYKDSDFESLMSYSSHIVFNSVNQWKYFRNKMSKSKISCGLRINPEHSEVDVSIYDPCSKFSRLGITIDNFDKNELEGIEGLHFHTLCESNADALQRTLLSIEKKFGNYINQMKWVNFGGGHHITRDDYDVDLLCNLLNDFRKKYNVQIFLEPGEAIVLNCGYFITSVIDIIHNQMDIAILDSSAAAHMPDVVEMPYTPNIYGAKSLDTYQYNYRLAGMTCLAGDIFGDYSFKYQLKPGTKLIFEDMAHYTMVKNNMFNGIKLPDIAILDEDNNIKIIKTFTYSHYRDRLS